LAVNLGYYNKDPNALLSVRERIAQAIVRSSE